jgi:hypothetical protein
VDVLGLRSASKKNNPVTDPPFGVEAQFWEQEEFRYSRRFDTRALAVQWAEEERKVLEKGGA